MNFTVIPAIDLRAGNVVRLRQGDYSQQTSYRVDPLRLAQDYAAAGASWLHVVDLDGARDGSLANFRLIEALAGTALQVQAGGGVRSEDDVQRLLDAGVARVVLGSVAIRQPLQTMQWLQRLGADRLCIALDTRQQDGHWRLPSEGWTQSEAPTLDELAPRYADAGAVHVLCTDIHRDGMLAGPNISLYTYLRQLVPGLQIQASGGVRDVADLHALRDCGVAGAVLGRSLLEGRLDLTAALKC
ncbi:1-(5-phosphoribosyl)-5-[(5-phosphoribosylamino)methylideneamino] imidazole-4-carboxamide isomerase [Tahibacter aquaticus]|uniref:1-(5-phosphoribosyl)-5-[(5-phosphoribosylamino)methylideneamino] imidazole-4-carboxamide isomerase n=1 Tax=Tahibacter aquaticus TaxID=520092 RepID=A0A4R6YY56_9GAMM|nr:1-(5-phosphoribosyl)-5-[(5-phosphoribosylamino)methylideneamino]imidazole-4-carboxamide isomerase [Tahibacter aquaticus]TDR43939.1 1-(5-phosphoribosyl)-5-[(5-phosphoribosylamino)methylideneamino] imidazole-4-carboxamide isomerase [Tahibacter aquaticus]